MDESGAPGATTRNNDYLTVSLVVFANQASAEKCSASIDRLRKRLNLPDSYEFHYSRNSTKARDALIKLIPSMDFNFITIAIRKNKTKTHASYPRIAEYLIREIANYSSNMQITMDSNPTLSTLMRRQAKKMSVTTLNFRQMRSGSHNMIQLADYVTAMSTRKLKGSVKAIEQYRPLIKKQIAFIEK